MGIDGEDLRYQREITWENMHNNIEVMFDSEAYFREYNSFVNDDQLSIETYIDKVTAQIISRFDTNSDGKLDRNETQTFMQSVLGADWDESQFEVAFTALDKGVKGYIDLSDLQSFLNEN